MEELLQGTAQAKHRLEEAERRSQDTAAERAAKRSKLQFAGRQVNPASSVVQVPATLLGGDACKCPQ